MAAQGFHTSVHLKYCKDNHYANTVNVTGAKANHADCGEGENFGKAFDDEASDTAEEIFDSSRINVGNRHFIDVTDEELKLKSGCFKSEVEMKFENESDKFWEEFSKNFEYKVSTFSSRNEINCDHEINNESDVFLNKFGQVSSQDDCVADDKKGDSMGNLYDDKIVKLTHTDQSGKLNMVDISDKASTTRVAIATGIVYLGEQAFQLVKENRMKKGDVTTVAKIAGINGAKRTSDLIPLCHNIPLSKVSVDIELNQDINAVIVTSLAKSYGKTGVEMEALTAVTVAALTVYDMCKAVSKDIVIGNIQLIHKSGGKSGEFNRN